MPEDVECRRSSLTDKEGQDFATLFVVFAGVLIGLFVGYMGVLKYGLAGIIIEFVLCILVALVKTIKIHRG